MRSHVPLVLPPPSAPTLSSPPHPALMTALRKQTVKARGSVAKQSSLGCGSPGRTARPSVARTQGPRTSTSTLVWFPPLTHRTAGAVPKRPCRVRTRSVGSGSGQRGCTLAVWPGKFLYAFCASVSSTKSKNNNSAHPRGCEDLGSYCMCSAYNSAWPSAGGNVRDCSILPEQCVCMGGINILQTLLPTSCPHLQPAQPRLWAPNSYTTTGSFAPFFVILAPSPLTSLACGCSHRGGGQTVVGHRWERDLGGTRGQGSSSFFVFPEVMVGGFRGLIDSQGNFWGQKSH